MKKVLIVSHAFPPSGKVAALRIGKFAKYLPQFGWTPLVLTKTVNEKLPHSMPVEIEESNIIRVPSYRPVLSIYDSLGGKQFHSHSHLNRKWYWKRIIFKFLKIFRPFLTLPFINIFLLGPIIWYRKAVKRGLELIQKDKIDVIFSSYGPSSSHFVASRLHKITGIPWVADFRDLWSENPNSNKVQPFQFFEKILEKKVINGSKVLIATSRPCAMQLEALHVKKAETIHNGFDGEDYSESISLTEKFTITYTGTIYRKQDPTPLFKSIKELARVGIISPENFEVRFYGSAQSILVPFIEMYQLSSIVKVYNFIPFENSIKCQKESTVLLLLTWTDIRQKGIYTGKLFEYFGAGRPILGIGPKDGVVDKLITDSGSGIVADNTDEIRGILSCWLKEFEESGVITTDFKPNYALIKQYTRREATAKLAHVLDEAISM